MNQYNTIFSRGTDEYAKNAAYVIKSRSSADTEHHCAYPSCMDKVWRDHFCWDHYQHENYTGR